MNGVRVFAAAAVTLIATVFSGVSGGHAQPTGRSLNIRISWITPGPNTVLFEGSSPFDKTASQFVAPVALDQGAAVHDIAVVYGAFQVPLRVVVGPQRDRDMMFTVTGPSFSGCDLPTVRKLATASPAGTLEERLALLISARRLIGLCSGLAREQPKLVRKYYELSCSLAGDRGGFFAIHADATERFAGLEETPYTKKTLEDCRGRGVGPEIGRIWRAAQAAQARGDSVAVAALIQDLLAKSTDEAWQDGFEAQHLTPTDIHELEVMDLKSRQNSAARERDFDRAIELNDQLQSLRTDGEYTDAFSNVGVTGGLLGEERANFEGGRAAAAGP